MYDVPDGFLYCGVVQATGEVALRLSMHHTSFHSRDLSLHLSHQRTL